MRMRPLARFQRAVLEFIAVRIAETGKSPSHQEMARHFGCASTGGITSPINQLEKKGYLARARGKHRAITVLRTPEADAKTPALEWLKRRVANEAKAETVARP